MPEDDDGRTKSGWKQLIEQAEHDVQTARTQYWAERVSRGPVSLSTRQQLATAALQYRDVLLEYSDVNSVEELWDEHEIDSLEQLAHNSVTVNESVAGDTNAVQQVERPAIVAIDPKRLVDATHHLDEVALKLGFGEEPNYDEAHDEPEHDDLRGLLEVRGQDEALDNIEHVGGDN